MTASLRDTRTEKQVEHSGDKAMASLGFNVWRYSQSRATNQSPGIPDRRYVNAVRGLAIYWEAKREGGKQSLPQRAFELECKACGEHYVCGTDHDLAAAVVALMQTHKPR